MPASINLETVRDWISLSLVTGVGPALFFQLISRYGSPTGVLDGAALVVKESASLRSGSLVELHDISRLRRRADQELKALDKIGARALVRDEPDYPELLGHIKQPPPVVYLHGDCTLLKMNAVAIVGSRAATSYGRRVCRAFARDLALAGICVVSGLASGIDAEAHGAALDADGATVGVLGCGLDVVYPRGNRLLFERLRESGLLLSEYPLGTRPEGFRFPARNRIIAGLSLAVLVVEASKRSGSLITVQHGLEEGRDIYAVPGQVDSVKSGGTHWLVQQGAALAVSADDILSQLGSGQSCTDDPAPDISVRPGLPPYQETLLALIEPYPQSREALLHQSGLPAAQFNEALLMLELEGLVRRAPGNTIYMSTEGSR